MVILLTLQESPEEIISGIPESVFLTANVPSTIFFTLDGTDPDIDSEMYVDGIAMPTSGTTITLKAIAISGIMQSAILEETYSTDQSGIDRTRLVGDEGINLLPPGSTVVDNLSVDEDGLPSQSSSIPFVDLDIQASTRNNIGEDIPGDTTIDFINLPNRVRSPEPAAVSSPNDSIDFDPRASLIIIDGTTEENRENQVVRIINRPRLSMDLISPIHANNQGEQQLVTSHLVRTMRNPITGVITFYYRDSRENRWIKSTQIVESETLNISPNAAPPSSFVFRWIENRAQTKIF
jgi:hypothetical protein